MNRLTNETEMDALITSYLERGLQKEELCKLRNWLDASDGNKSYFAYKQEIWLSSISSNNESRFDKEKAYKRFIARTRFSSKSLQKGKRAFLHTFQRIAAAVALLIVFAGTGYWFGSNKSNRQLSDVLIETPSGSRTKMHLPDGTSVWLNSDSRISYSQNFGEKDRMIKLDGEGYFKVHHDKNHPFKVQTKEIMVECLGTEFNLKAYDKDDQVVVMLAEGRVRVHAPETKVLLAPNTCLTYDKMTKSLTKVKVKSDDYTLWRNGEIRYNDESLENIAKDLSRMFNVNVIIKSKQIGNERFTGYLGSCSLRNILNTLSKVSAMEYRIENDSTVYILSKNRTKGFNKYN